MFYENLDNNEKKETFISLPEFSKMLLGHMRLAKKLHNTTKLNEIFDFFKLIRPHLELDGSLEPFQQAIWEFGYTVKFPGRGPQFV